MSWSGFKRCLDVTWLPENDGQPFHTTPDDPGGATAWGVTLGTFSAWREKHGGGPATSDELARAEPAELQMIFYNWFWLPIRGDELPVGVDLVLFEIGVLSGPGRACQMVKKAVGLTLGGHSDYIMDTSTLRDIQNYPVRGQLIREIFIQYSGWLASLGEGEFIQGWGNRLRRDQATAMGWLQTGSIVS